LTLGTDKIEYIPNVRSFKCPKEGKGEWIAYQLKDDPKSWLCKSTLTDKWQV
jgi:hypothetical protein